MKAESSPYSPSTRWEDAASRKGSSEANNDSSQRLHLHPIPAWKRCLDFVVIFVSLPLLLPLMIAIAIWIRLVSKGPVLFLQDRVGFDGKVFRLRKFRTMKPLANDEIHTEHVRDLMKTNKRMTKLDQLGDGRLIRGGIFLRTTGLDELPQLLNVIRGELSLVGPRPCVKEEFILYGEEEKNRFRVHPGLTGYWQVMGKNKTTFKEMIGMDDYYVANRSLGLDCWIILKTPFAILDQVSGLFRGQGKNRKDKC